MTAGSGGTGSIASAGELRCHHCSHFIGEAGEPMEYVGTVESRSDRDLIPAPRWSWKCKCGRTTVFRRLAPTRT